MPSPDYRYRLDARDRIRFVSSGWLAFAERNGAPALEPETVVGRSIWDFVAGKETQHLYRLLFAAVRDRKRSATVPFRCDSPDCVREMLLTIVPLPDGAVDLTARLVQEVPRPPVEILDPELARGDEYLKICSWCKQVLIEPDEWVDVEIAVDRLGLFEGKPLPQLTHGVCPGCRLLIDAELDTSPAPPPKRALSQHRRGIV